MNEQKAANLIVAINGVEEQLKRVATALENQQTPEPTDRESGEPVPSDAVHAVRDALEAMDTGTGFAEHVECVKAEGDNPRVVLEDDYEAMSDDQIEAWYDATGADGAEWVSVTEWGETDDGGSFPMEKAVLLEDIEDMRGDVLE